MKIITSQPWVVGRALRARRGGQRSARPTNQDGSAVVVILILLCIMLLFVAANTLTLNWLRAQVNAVDKHQTQRLALASTNQMHSAQSVNNQPGPK